MNLKQQIINAITSWSIHRRDRRLLYDLKMIQRDAAQGNLVFGFAEIPYTIETLEQKLYGDERSAALKDLGLMKKLPQSLVVTSQELATC